MTIVRQLELQVPPRQKFQSCEVWFINWSTCANRTSNNFLSYAGKSVSCGMSCGPSGQPQYLHPRQQAFPTHEFPRESVVLLILMPRVVLQGSPTGLCQVSSAIIAAPIARVRDARCTRARHPVVPGSAGEWVHHSGVQVLHQRNHCTSQRCRLHRGPVCSSSGCGEVTRLWWACTRRIAIISNAALLPPLPDVIRTAVS